MQIDRGYISPYFITNGERQIVEFDNPLVLITDKKISAIADLIPVLENVPRLGRPLLIIAEDIDGEAMATFILNKIKGVFNVLAIQAPAFGYIRKAMLEDLAVLTGATFISTDLGMQLKAVTIDYLCFSKPKKFPYLARYFLYYRSIFL